jgi:DNA-binding beta-propeller fold protein YncE
MRDASGASSGRTPVEGRLTALAAAPGGGFYAVFADRAELRRYGADGKVLDRWTLPGQPPVPAWPSGIALRPDGDLVVVDRHNGRLLVLNGAGRLELSGARPGWLPGQLRCPAGVAVLPDGRIAVVDQGNGRLQLFREIETGDGS